MSTVFQRDLRAIIGVHEAGAGALIGALWRQEPLPRSSPMIFAGPGAAIAMRELSLKCREGPFNPEQIFTDLDEFDPKIVVTGASLGDSVERLLLSYARRRGIHTVSVVDGYVNLWQRFCGKQRSDSWAWLPDKVVVVNQEVRRRLLSHGCPPERVHSLSRHPLPSSEIVDLSVKGRRNSIREELGLPQGCRFITLIHETGLAGHATWGWDNPLEVVREHIKVLVETLVQEVLRERAAGENLFLVVKEHPTDRCPDFCESTIDARGDAVRLVHKIDRHALVGESTAVFGVGSMLLHEAAQLCSYCVSLKLTPQGRYPFPEYTAGLRVATSAESLRIALREGLVL